MNHIPRKRFGQNFLTDQGVIQSIVRAINPKPGDVMVEIGPGLGALTDPLLKILPHLHVVEIDRDIIARLENNYPKSKLTIHAGDALKFDFSTLGERIRIIGNLPYNISTPILFHLSEYVGNIIDMHFMLQKEVVERMVAAPSTPEYGRLSVMLQYRYAMELQFIVPPDAFQPAPKVESAIVRMIPYAELPHPARDEALFGAIVTAAFGQRRKVLRNTLKAYLDNAGFTALGIDPGLRAENLGVAEFVAIANYCKV
ncbi:MAG TPA: 16S rRNA (adenine(1518)-N(6)/adenine(1519)-N(6))-dimethyltransferase RsmA [Sulfuricella sp.]|nr:16S rRNA (adenine(1518)-N(6)/adenine(1519)-N(6))-dimethyltransferase RsmA [Sulfuricella sp.]